MAEVDATERESSPRDTLDDIDSPYARSSNARTSSRLLQVGAFALIASALGVVVASAAPAVAREIGITEVRVVQRDFVRAAPAGQAGVDAVRDFEKGIGRSIAELDVVDDVAPPAESAKIAFSFREVTLRERPSHRSREIGTAQKGEALVLLKEELGWGLVVHQTDRDGIEVGWVPLRDVQVP